MIEVFGLGFIAGFIVGIVLVMIISEIVKMKRTEDD